VVLVAHGWGGFPATGACIACRPSRETRALHGHVPLSGRSLIDENPPDKRLSALRWITVAAIPATLDYVQQELMQGSLLTYSGWWPIC
jgi:hypothetical protein